ACAFNHSATSPRRNGLRLLCFEISPKTSSLRHCSSQQKSRYFCWIQLQIIAALSGVIVTYVVKIAFLQKPVVI
ncbi:MAG: hypothetical protein WAW60_02900, partial [Candidatus Saccharimonadales bacterium]